MSSLAADSQSQPSAVVQRQGSADASIEPSTPTQDPKRLVIVGAGMAGFGLCDRLVRGDAMDGLQVTLFGEERFPAYDRVNLSAHFGKTTPDELLLAPRDWYRQNDIQLVTGRRIVHIERDKKLVVDETGCPYPYDELVVATGSRPWVPPIRGAEGEGVFVYRTLDDLQNIKAYLNRKQTATDGSTRTGAVIGGGLLGLEAAQVLADCGLSVSVVEMAPGLMPRQLDAKAASRLRDQVVEMGVDVALVRRTQSITHGPSGRLTLRFENAEALEVDILIIAAGVRPNDELGRECGLKIGANGGIAVDGELRTSDPSIYAIGECASRHDHIFGLVAPCYRMADVLAARLQGSDEVFEGADESAELKLMGVQVVTLGQVIGDSPNVITLTNEDESGYRKLLIRHGCVVGAACVGKWDELAQVRQAVNKQQRLWPWNRTRFVRTGSPWAPGGAWPVQHWPEDSVICSCLGITHGKITSLIEEGCTTTDEIATRCGAGTGCGSCQPLVVELATGEPVTVKTPGTRLLLGASVATLIGVALLPLAFPLPMADSVQSAWRQIDVLWRNDLARQITGYSLVGVTVLAMVFSLRKRLGWFESTAYGIWRALHGALAAVAFVVFLIHTGGRIGANLNLLLAVSFVGALLLGAVAGIASASESTLRGRAALLMRSWRPRLTRLHLWITWPLPALILLHILAFYWFSE